VLLHLAVETALGDSRNYQVLSPEESDALKKALTPLANRIEATRQKLILETKLRDAAQSISRLPPARARGDSQGRSDGEGQERMQKCDDLAQELWNLEKQEQELRQRLLEHTAGVLQLTHKGYVRKDPLPGELGGGVGRSGGRDGDDFGDSSQYQAHPDITELERGLRTGDRSRLGSEFEEQNQLILDVERRVEDLNAQLREMILALRPRKEDLPAPAPQLEDSPDRPEEILWSQMDFLDRCIHTLHDLHSRSGQGTRPSDEAAEARLGQLNTRLFEIVSEGNPQTASEYAPPPKVSGRSLQDQLDHLEKGLGAVRRRLNASSQTSDRMVEEKLEELNTRLFRAMTENDPERAHEYTPPPEPSGGSLRDQIDYLEGGLAAIIRRAKQQGESPENASSELRRYQDRAARYVEVVGGLWDLLGDSHRGDASEDSFSLTAFSEKVRELHVKSASWQTQKEVLTRQIQQQRELNENSDAKRDKMIGDMRGELEHAKEELDHAKKQLDVVGDEAKSHLENLNVALVELESAKKALSSQGKQSTSHARAIEEEKRARGAAEDLLQRVMAQLKEAKEDAALTRANFDVLRSDAEEKARGLKTSDESLKELEGEVARLRTELVIAKTDLDTARGPRAQQAAEAAREISALRSRIETLQNELTDTIADYEAMTKASIEDERERERLENTVDTLRERIETLEAQISEEKVQNLASPGASSVRGGGSSMSVSVLKAEFKKIMKETRAEHLKALKASSLNGRNSWRS
jgi:hypothetical protein